MANFYDIEFLEKRCIRTITKSILRQGNQTGTIESEGCWAMEIINQSISEILTLTIKGEKFILDKALDLDPTAPIRTYRFANLVLPGHPAIVRSDQIGYSWESETQNNYSMIIHRHCVVPFQEAANVSKLYPVYL
jgi:hypothetical protein